jgi:hypothetical protein
MEATTVTFLTTPQETEKAWLAFSTSSEMGRLFQRFAFPVLAIIFFLITLKQNPSPTGDFAINGQPYPVITFLFRLYIPALFGLFFGWLFSALVKTVRKNRILEGLKNIPPEYFGEVNFTFDQSELSYHAPLLKVQYNWKLLDSVLVTPEFLFICFGKGLNQRLAFWLPMRALNNISSSVLPSIEKWLLDSKSQQTARSKTA